MLQAERQRLKDLGQELQVEAHCLRVGRDRKLKGFIRRIGGGGGEGRGKGEWRDSTVILKLQFTGICNIR